MNGLFQIIQFAAQSFWNLAVTVVILSLTFGILSVGAMGVAAALSQTKSKNKTK